MGRTLAFFGEAEKGEFARGYLCQTLPELVTYFGHPPEESRGLFYAIQALLYRHSLIFFRVHEEGFSLPDYQLGLELLKQEAWLPRLAAFCTPGIGNREIVDTLIPICLAHHQILLTQEEDLFDYLSQG